MQKTELEILAERWLLDNINVSYYLLLLEFGNDGTNVDGCKLAFHDALQESNQQLS